MRIYLAADHAGFELKKHLVEHLAKLGHEPVDCGADSPDPGDDYPEFVFKAAALLDKDAAEGQGSRALVIGASGQGEAMAANRFAHVRCALYYGSTRAPQQDASGETLDIIASARSHNDANALALGARFLSVAEATKAVERWLSIPFRIEERHRRRNEVLSRYGAHG